MSSSLYKPPIAAPNSVPTVLHHLHHKMSDHRSMSRREKRRYLRFWYRLHSTPGLTPPPLSDELMAFDNSLVAIRILVVHPSSPNSSPAKIEDNDEDTVMIDTHVDSATLSVPVAYPPVMATSSQLITPPLAIAPPASFETFMIQPPQALASRNSDVQYEFQQNFARYPTLRLHPTSPLTNSLPLPAPKCLLSYFTSCDKLNGIQSQADEDCGYRAIALGDVFRINWKDAILVSWQKGGDMCVTVEGVLYHDIVGPTDIARALGFNTDVLWPWAVVDVYRNGTFLGNLDEIRQAWAFRDMEFKFRGMLTFMPTHIYKLSTKKENDGYQVICQSGLYRKVRASEYHLHNKALMLDFGHTLNNSLANLAAHGHIIVGMDMRLLQNDGICARSKEHLQDTYNDGASAFTTAHCRRVAGGAGFSKGHACAGPLALSKGCNEVKGSRWSRDRGRGNDTDSLAVFGARSPNSWMRLRKGIDVGKETPPAGVQWTQQEIDQVTQWHLNNIQGRIIHDPIPVTRMRLLEIGQRQRQVPVQQIHPSTVVPILVAPAPVSSLAPFTPNP
ncbi:hypothetical protein BGZ60DRAFT_556853 [Tricladium varicosporioides]|nr:hypothetical protein BGZ60DRAFT_556853 [Hymenoscyphus varicosporioides]